jgi:hypothetical protein
MRIGVEVVEEALAVEGFDAVYEKLYDLFYEDGVIFIDKWENTFIPIDTEDLYDFLELLADQDYGD